MDIKKKVREVLLEQAKPKVAAGVLIKCIKTNRVLLLQRNEKGDRYHGVWSLMSGGIEEGESVIDGLKREVIEEMSINPNLINYVYIGEELTPQKSMRFHYYTFNLVHFFLIETSFAQKILTKLHTFFWF